MMRTGTQAPKFSLGQFSLDSPTEPILLAFFKASCPTCQFTFPFLQTLADRAGLRIVGISQDDSETTDEFTKAFGIRFQMISDPAPTYTVSNAYRLKQVPSLFLVEPDGSVGWASEGFAKQDLERLAQRWGVTLFDANDRVPLFKPG